MSLGHPDWIGACGAYLSGLEASSRRGLVVTVFTERSSWVFLRGMAVTAGHGERIT